MKATVLALVGASFLCTSCSQFERSGAVGSSTRLTRKWNKSSVKEVDTPIREELNSGMQKFKEKLSTHEKSIRNELTLSPSKKAEVSNRLKSLPTKTPSNEKESSRHSIEEINTKAGVAGVLFQGDIVLSDEQQREILASIGGTRPKRQAYNDKTYPGRRWYKGLIFSLDGNLPNETRKIFLTAAQLWMNNTCINFIEDKNETSEDLMIVYRGHGCWSKIGRQGDWQFMSLGDGCGQVGVAAHEIGHALGFWHTQSRYDRDDFITVVEENVNATYLDEFLKQTMETNNNYGLTYDYGSLMHYGARSGATDKAAEAGNFTMLPKDDLYTETLGSDIIAFYDLLMMNIYYNCTDACKEAHTRCYNDGFPHPRNCSKCICPSGYGGQFCNERPRGCGDVLRATKGWKSLEGEVCRSEISTDGFMRCTYWIEAPPGKKVKVKLVELPGFEDDGCVSVGVEIKTHPDQRRTGYRFCSSAYINKTLTSASSRVPVIFYKKYESKPHIVPEDTIYDDEDGGGFFGNDEDGREEEEQVPTGITIDYRYV